jgi:hypothetical protein
MASCVRPHSCPSFRLRSVCSAVAAITRWARPRIFLPISKRSPCPSSPRAPRPAAPNRRLTEAVIREFIRAHPLPRHANAGRRCRCGSARHDPEANHSPAHLQLGHTAVVELSSSPSSLPSRSPLTTAASSTRTRTTSSASSTNPQPTCPRSSRKIRRHSAPFAGVCPATCCRRA